MSTVVNRNVKLFFYKISDTNLERSHLIRRHFLNDLVARLSLRTVVKH